MSDRKVNDLPTGFPVSDYEHWMLEHAKDTPWTESGGKATIRDLVDLAGRATDTAIDLAHRLSETQAELTRLRTELAEARADGIELLRRAQAAEDTNKRLYEALQALATGDWLKLHRLLEESRAAHATVLRECQTLIAERDTLRQQLAVAREGLEEIANRRTERRHEATRIIARDTLAKLDQMQEKP